MLKAGAAPSPQAPNEEFTAEDINHLEYAGKCGIKLEERSSFISREILNMTAQYLE